MKSPLTKIAKLYIILLVLAVACALTILVNDFNSMRTIENTDSLSGQRIGVMSGWESDYYLTSTRNDITLKRYDATADLFLALGYRQIDAAALDKATYAQACHSISGLKTVGDPLITTNYTVEVKKGNDELLNEINNFFAYLKQSDEYDEFVEHYFDMDWIDSGEMTKPTGTGKTITIGYPADYYPFEYITPTGEVRGNEVELMTLFANYYNYQLEYREVTSQTCYMDLDTGKIDILIASTNDMYRSETLSPVSPVSMSDGYIESDVYCVVADGEVVVNNTSFYDMTDY